MTVLHGFDRVQTFQIEDFTVRGRLVRLDGALNALCQRHDYPIPVASLLGQAAVLTALFSCSLKHGGTFVLQIQGDGPLSMILIELAGDGALRGYARFDKSGVEALMGRGESKSKGEDDAAPAMTRLFGSGRMVFSIERGADGGPYQGISALIDGDLRVSADEYFRQCEGFPTEIALFNEPAADGRWRAGAIAIQKMPGPGTPARRQASADDWRGAVLKMRSMTRAEFLSPELSPETLAYRLYHEDGVRIFNPRPLFHHCRCCREKIANTLRSFPREKIVDDGGNVQVTCEFCKSDYFFDGAALDRIYRRGGA